MERLEGKLEEVTEEKRKAGTKVVMFNAKEISKIFNININRSTNFLKNYGVKVGHWQIEENKLLSILREQQGELLG